MQLDLEPGRYVVAVSGGVDSMVLLDLLRRLPGVELVVAHYDHGIREDSAQDRQLIQDVTARHSLPFVYEEGRLGPDASEARARDARYGFLRRVRAEQGARGVITAHHQDDVLETAILNGLRGTGSRGLASLQSGEIIRPLLRVPKQQLLEYATRNGVVWREDSTNQDLKYRRNYVRHLIIPRMTATQRATLLMQIDAAVELNREIDQLVTKLLAHQHANTLERAWFIGLPHNVAAEVMASWLRAHDIAFDRRTIQRLVVFVKTTQPGKQADLDARHVLHAGGNVVTLTDRYPEQ